MVPVYCKTCNVQLNSCKYKNCQNCREKDRLKSKKKHKRRLEKTKGAMMCTRCSETNPENFIPIKHRQKYMKLLNQPRTLFVMKQLIALKSVRCKKCNKLSPNQQACKDKWLELKHRMVHYGGCVNCGIKDIDVLEADHCIQKINILSDYTFWPTQGGPVAMEIEFLKTQCLCSFHHRLKSHNERQQTRQMKTMSVQACISTFRTENQLLNISLKMSRKHCLICKRIFSEKESPAFDWDHRDPVDKKGNVAVLVLNNNPEMLKSEIEKCDLLCANCHKKKTDMTIRNVV